MLLEVSLTTTVPGLVTVTVGVIDVVLESDAIPLPLTILHTPEPFVTVPERLKVVLFPVAHLLWSDPATAVGRGFTVKITSSVSVPQAGSVVLVPVSCRTTEPVPTTLTVEVMELELETVALPLTTLHKPVPFATEPCNVKIVASPVAHNVWFGPALATGSGLTVNVTSLKSLPQAGFVLLVTV